MNNYNLLRKLFIIIIILSLLYTLFTNSTSSQRLDDLAYVVAIGVDVGEVDTYKVSFQVSTVKSSSSDSSGGSGEGGSGDSSSGGTSSGSERGPTYIVNTVECSSIDMGINLLNTYVNKQINLSHCKILLISENVAKNGVSPIIYTLVNKVEIRPDCNIIISKIPTEDFINTVQPSTQDVLAKYFDLTSSSTEQETGYSQNITLSQFYSYLKDPFCQPYAALGTVSNPKGKKEFTNKNATGIDKTAGNIQSESKEPLVELLGLAVFRDDVLVGELTGMETVCHLILKNELQECTISIPSPFNDNNVDIYVSIQKSPKINVYIDKNGSPFVKINVNIISRLLSFNNNQSKITQESISQVETAAENYITNELYNYLNKTSKDLQSDVSSIGKYAVSNFLTQEDWNNYNWLKNYSSCTFQVTTDITLKSGYLLTMQ